MLACSWHVDGGLDIAIELHVHTYCRLQHHIIAVLSLLSGTLSIDSTVQWGDAGFAVLMPLDAHTMLSVRTM